ISPSSNVSESRSPSPSMLSTNSHSSSPSISESSSSSTSASWSLSPSPSTCGVEFTKTGPDEVVPGESATYTLKIINDNPYPLKSVVIKDTIPQYTTSDSAKNDGWECGSSECSYSVGRVENHTTVTKEFVVIVNEDVHCDV